MKKKLLIGLLAAIVVTLSAMTLLFVSACGGDDIMELTKLDNPVINGYDPETGKVSWKFVSNADKYEVSISDGVETKTSEVKTGSITYTTTADSFEFSITAKSNSVYTDSDTVSVTFVRLSGAIALTADDDGTVTWESVDGATGYEVAVDNTTAATVVDTKYSEVKAGAVHAVRVKPVKANNETTIYFSSWSAPITINKLKEVSPSAINYDDGAIKWTAVASAVSYKVVINNEEHDTTEPKFAYDAQGESFTVAIQAIGNHTSTYDGALSKQKSFVYLAAVSGVRVENGALTWDAVEGATGYKVKVNGANSTATAVTEAKYNKLSAGTQYSVSVIPTATAEDTVFFSDWSAPENVYILPAPNIRWANLDVDGVDKVRAIIWDAVDGCAGYRYKVTLPDGTVDEGALGELNNFYEDNFATTGTYKVEVKATSAPDSGKYDSAYSTPLNVTRLAAPTVSQSNITSTASNLEAGFAVSFGQVTGASGYAIYKDGNRVNTSTTPQFKVTNVVPADNTRDQQVAYYIQSTGKISGNNVTLNSLSAVAQSTLSSAFTVKVLATPTAPTMEGTTYSFTGAVGGSGYNVSIGANNYTAAEESLDLDSLLQAGGYDVKVCTMGNGHEVLASTYSTALRIERLVAPYDLKITTDESDGVLKFEGDSHAHSYTAVITGVAEPLTVDTTTNIREYINTTNTVVYLYSVANYFSDSQNTLYYMTSKAGTATTFYKLEAPGNVSFTNEYMQWNAPSNHSSSSSYTPPYKILDGSDDTVYNGRFTGTSYSLANLEGGKTYSFNIIAIGDGTTCINSDPAHSKAIEKLYTPVMTVNTTDFCYQWESVPSASDYVLQIDDQIVSTEIHQSGNVYSYSPNYKEIGTHKVVLYALGDNGETTVNSSNCEYNQVVKQLTTPEFAYSYGADSYDPAAEVTVTVTKETNCPNGYNYVIGTTTHYEKTTSYSFNPNTSGDLDIYVYAKGGSFDAEEVYYLDSRAATTVNLTLLGYPTENSIELNKDGILTWGKIDAAKGYIVKLTIVGTDDKTYIYSNVIGNNTPSLQLGVPGGFKVTDENGAEVTLTWAKVKTMTLKLQAKGNLTANQTTTYNGTVTSAKVTKAWTSDLH